MPDCGYACRTERASCGERYDELAPPQIPLVELKLQRFTSRELTEIRNGALYSYVVDRDGRALDHPGDSGISNNAALDDKKHDPRLPSSFCQRGGYRELQSQNG